jgi:uncharacterized membrane protein
VKQRSQLERILLVAILLAPLLIGVVVAAVVGFLYLFWLFAILDDTD